MANQNFVVKLAGNRMTALIDRAVPVPGPPGPVGPAGPAGPVGPTGPPGAMTPWTENVDANTFNLSNVGRLTVLNNGITVGGASPVLNSINITGQFLINGVPLAGAGVPTPAIFSVNGVQIGVQPELNLIAADSSVTLSGLNNTGATRVDVTVSATGGVPATRQVIAGAGMTGGGPLSADVTLNANVLSVNGHTGAVVLSPADIAASGGVPATRQIITSTGLTGGGDLSVDRTLSVVADTTVQQHRISLAGSLIGTRRELNFIQGSGVTLTVTDDGPLNRVNIAVTGTGGAAQTPWLSNILGGGFKLSDVSAIGIGMATATYPLQIRMKANQNVIFNGNGIPAMQWLNDALSAYIPVQYMASGHYFMQGNVGIGTTGPVSLLHLYTPSTSVNVDILTIQSAYSVVSVEQRIKFFGVGGFHLASIGAGFDPATAGDGYLAFGTGGNTGGVGFHSEKMRIAYNGNVGIGQVAPAYKLDVTGDVNVTGAYRVNGVPIATGGGSQWVTTGSDIYYNVGKVAVGTLSPTSKLTVIGPTAVDPSLTFNAANTFQFSSGSPGVSLAGGVYTGAPNGFWLQVRDAGASGYSYPLILNPLGGNVGIGTASPFARLAVVGPAVGLPALGTESCAFAVHPNSNTWGLFFGGLGDGTCWMQAQRSDTSTAAYPILINPLGGSVGIGTMAPQSLLHLIGSTGGGIIFQMEPSSVSVVSLASCNTISWKRYWDNWNVASIGQRYSLGAQYGGVLAFYTHPDDGVATNPPLERLTILANGNVGIGTAAPASRLSFGATEANIGSRVAFFETAGSANFRGIGMTNSGAGQYGVAIWAHGTAVPSATNMQFFVQDGGNVGIGTANPQSRLTINTTTDTNLGFGYDASQAASYIAALNDPGNSNLPLCFQASKFNFYGYGGTGNVGISNSNAQYKLDVAGDVNCTGTFRVNGVPISTGGGITTQTPLVGSRVLNTIYRNTTGKAIFVVVCASLTSGGSALQGITDGFTTPANVVAVQYNGSTQTGVSSIGFWVLNNNYYKVWIPAGSGTLSYWNEWS